MSRLLYRWVPLLAVLIAVPGLLGSPEEAQAQKQKQMQDELAGFRTVETAITAKIGKFEAAGSVQSGYLGIHVTLNKKGQLTVAQMDSDSPAAKAGVEEGDILSRVAGQEIKEPRELKQALVGKAPGQAVKLEVLRDGKNVEVSATLAAPSQPMGGDQGAAGGGKGWDARKGGFKKNTYRLAVIIMEYPDSKVNPKITTKDWDEQMFSRGGVYTKSATGGKAYGSLHDHYKEQSYGTFSLEGKTFPPVQVSKKRTDYGQQGANRTALLTEALDKLLQRDGKDALNNFDGVFFMYAGGRVQVARGSLYWPHRSSVKHGGKSWPYFICPEGGGTMANISVFAHEFGHMVGLPDLYAAPERPGSEGLGNWCLMSNQVGNGRPQHMSAWCKEQLGWLKPVLIDPTVPQKLILKPIQSSPKECYKIAIRTDGSEYLMLENRNAKGFDASLPAHGLLIWRVVKGRPTLEESHGVSGPAGPRSSPTLVPFPSKSNDAFTPNTVPSSKALLGGGLPVHITNIRKLPDERITFYIGYEFY